MGFYYTSIFSIVPLGIAYGILALLFWGVARAARGIRRRGLVLGVVGVVFLLLPISEELWIAWNFGQACKEAGTFIHKKVQVEGFYDDTGASLEMVKSGPYRFIESRERDGTYIRVTFGNEQLLREATARFAETNPGKDPQKQDYFRLEIADRTEALVYPRRGESWRIEHLDRPTARYWFAVDQGERVAHKLDVQRATVTDKQSNEVIARYARYSREAPWYFIGLDRPNLGCDEPGVGPHSKHSFLIYRDVLIPPTSSGGAIK